MKFKCGKTVEEIIADQKQERDKVVNFKPKRWFAWYPVETIAGDCRWLEWVEYKYRYSDYGDRVIIWGWWYRAIE